MSVQQALAVAESAAVRHGGKNLAFALGKKEFGLEFLKVRKVIACMEITATSLSGFGQAA